jgi:XTP/dITP diphosphohydrolase
MLIKKLLFATSNLHKVREAQEILNKYQITIDHYPINLPELQDDSLKEIAKFAASEIDPEIKDPIIVEDTGLFIEALNGFPGPYSAFVFRTIGNEGILRLMQNITNRKAYFMTIIVLRALPKNSSTFEYFFFQGEARGKISLTVRGEQWGYDPIFEPEGEEGLTYAEITEKKNQISHRTKAFQALGAKISRG